jgi:RpiR family carbohydrate utilization transcriptional regulator
MQLASSSLLARIAHTLQQGDLSPSESKLAQELLENPARFSRGTAASLAQAVGVSPPTVVRFCRRLGFSGLADFKLSLAESLGASGVPYVHQSVGTRDSMTEIAQKMAESTHQTLQLFARKIDESRYKKALDRLEKCLKGRNRLVIFGVGSSGLVSMDAEHKFQRLGMHASAYRDGHLQVITASLCQPEDLVLVISNAGRSADLLEVTKLAQSRGTFTIAITSSHSPLSQIADLSLVADHAENYDLYSPMVSRILHLTLIDMLTTGLAIRLGPSLGKRLKNIKSNLRIRYQ